MKQTRRTFLATIWLAALAAAGVLLRASSAAAKKIAIDLEKLSALKKEGGSAIVSLKKKKILFIRGPGDTLHAMKPECTHQKCAVQYKKKWGEIRCTCHGSTFDVSGKVQKGPADKDLRTYPAKIENGKVVVTL